jgi:hypothetical protein
MRRQTEPVMEMKIGSGDERVGNAIDLFISTLHHQG